MKIISALIVFLNICCYCKSQVAVDSIIKNKQIKSVFFKDISIKFKSYFISNNFDTSNERLSKSTKINGICKSVISVLSYNSYCNFNSGLVNAYMIDFDFFRDIENFQIGFLELIYPDNTTADRKFKEFNKKRSRGRSLEEIQTNFKLLKTGNRIIVIESYTVFNPKVHDFITSGNLLSSNYEETKIR